MYGTDRIDRRLFFWIARRLYSARTAEPPGAEGPGKLLVVRIDERVGNLVTLQSLLDALRKGLPQAELGLLASIRSAPVAQTLQGIDRLHLIDKRWFFTDPGSFRGVVSEIRKTGYQVALDASAWHVFSFNHATLTYYSGAPVRIGYRRGVKGFLTETVEPGPKNEYELQQRMRLLKPLGIDTRPPRLRSALGEIRQADMARWLETNTERRPIIGIWPGSRKLERRWPVEHYAHLARLLVKRRSAFVVVLWGPGEEGLRDELTGILGGDSVAAPSTDLEELAGLLRGLDLLVTNDTGPMHLSVAVKTPTACLFASGDPDRWGHPGRYVRNLKAPGSDPREVDAAAEACLELLDRD